MATKEEKLLDVHLILILISNFKACHPIETNS
jgi:hypothetical protein